MFKGYHVFKMDPKYAKGNLILQICTSIVLGTILGIFSKDLAQIANLLGILFINALKAIAPILVFILILSSICTKNFSDRVVRLKILLYFTL